MSSDDGGDNAVEEDYGDGGDDAVEEDYGVSQLDLKALAHGPPRKLGTDESVSELYVPDAYLGYPPVLTKDGKEAYVVHYDMWQRLKEHEGGKFKKAMKLLENGKDAERYGIGWRDSIGTKWVNSMLTRLKKYGEARKAKGGYGAPKDNDPALKGFDFDTYDAGEILGSLTKVKRNKAYEDSMKRMKIELKKQFNEFFLREANPHLREGGYQELPTKKTKEQKSGAFSPPSKKKKEVSKEDPSPLAEKQTPDDEREEEEVRMVEVNTPLLEMPTRYEDEEAEAEAEAKEKKRQKLLEPDELEIKTKELERIRAERLRLEKQEKSEERKIGKLTKKLKAMEDVPDFEELVKRAEENARIKRMKELQRIAEQNATNLFETSPKRSSDLLGNVSSNKMANDSPLIPPMPPMPQYVGMEKVEKASDKMVTSPPQSMAFPLIRNEQDLKRFEAHLADYEKWVNSPDESQERKDMFHKVTMNSLETGIVMLEEQIKKEQDKLESYKNAWTEKFKTVCDERKRLEDSYMSNSQDRDTPNNLIAVNNTYNMLLKEKEGITSESNLRMEKLKAELAKFKDFMNKLENERKMEEAKRLAEEEKRKQEEMEIEKKRAEEEKRKQEEAERKIAEEKKLAEDKKKADEKEKVEMLKKHIDYANTMPADSDPPMYTKHFESFKSHLLQ